MLASLRMDRQGPKPIVSRILLIFIISKSSIAETKPIVSRTQLIVIINKSSIADTLHTINQMHQQHQ